jgi:polyhydroxyalkanoate synthesis regulator phasin
MTTSQEQQKHFNEIADMLAEEEITTEQACSLIEDLRDAGKIADEMDTEEEQQKGFNEIAWILADWKITTEEACQLFNEWLDEWKPKK